MFCIYFDEDQKNITNDESVSEEKNVQRIIQNQ